MEQRKINPWKWQDALAFSQAIEVSNASRTLYVAGQASVDDKGAPVHVGDMRKQLEQAYRDAGYKTVVVIIPEQEVVGGEVQLQVTEGRVEKVRVKGAGLIGVARRNQSV